MITLADAAIQIAESSAAAPTTMPSASAAVSSTFEWFRPPSHWPATCDVLNWCQNMSPGGAAILMFCGLVYLLFGYYLFKGLVMLNAALLGAYIGAFVGAKGNADVAGAMMGAFIAAAVTWPLMKWAVAIMGGVVGAILGASIWRSFGLDAHFAWAGGLSGLIFFGMLSFILFRGSIMMYTSLQGSVMLIFGILGVICKYQNLAPQITESMTSKSFILPAAILVPAVVGLIYQQHQATTSLAEAGKKKS